MNNILSDDENKDYKCILSIDGGGMKGILPLAFLKHIEENLHDNLPIGKYFDLISGTSTGGLIASGLALGKSASFLYDQYKENGPGVFSEVAANDKPISRQMVRFFYQYLFHKVKWSNKVPDIPDFLDGPRYSADKLAEIIDSIVPAEKFDEFEIPLLITAWDANRKVRLFKTRHVKHFQENHLIKDALMATTAAPLLFPEFVTAMGNSFIDGAVWANDPTAVAIVEAISILKWDPKNVRVLSLGCSDELYTFGDNTDFFDRVKDALRLFLDGQSKGAQYISETLLNDQVDDRVFRISPTVEKNRFSLDTTDKTDITMLSGMGVSEAIDEIDNLYPIFFKNPAKPMLFYQDT